MLYSMTGRQIIQGLCGALDTKASQVGPQKWGCGPTDPACALGACMPPVRRLQR